MRIRFEEFVLDEERHTLLRNGQEVHLTRKAMKLLAFLIRHRPSVVSREELFDHVWPDVIVSAERLKNLVAEVRHALDDHERNGRFLRNVHGEGYAFVGEPTIETGETAFFASVPGVSLIHGEKRFLLWPGDNLVGRGADCNVLLDREEVSRHHALVVVSVDGVKVEDLHSKNGTTVNESRIDSPMIVRNGDTVGFGPVQMTVSVSISEGSTKSAT